jgi:DNA-binding PadR family transcriptional regulator
VRHGNFGRRGGGTSQDYEDFGTFRDGQRRGHGRGGDFGPRLLNRGELRLLLLKLLETGPRHGYELIKGIKARSAGAYAPSPGILYPTLASLAEAGAISATADGMRKLFSLNESGRTEVAGKAEELDALLARLEETGKTRAATESGPVRRAMDNLGQVLSEATSREELDRDVQHEIAAILDDAARRIERL